MWMVAAKGFLSVVAVDWNKVQKTGPKVSRRDRRRLGPDALLIRARVKADIDQVKPFYPHLKIFEGKTADYQWRAFIPRKAYAEFCYDAAMKIDYTSHFKEVVRDRSSKVEGRYTAMMGAWTAFEKIQDRPAFGGYTYTGSSSLCDFREIKEIKDGGEKVYGRWCTYSKTHTGLHSFQTTAKCQHVSHVEGEDGKWYGKWSSNSDASYPCSQYPVHKIEGVRFEKFAYSSSSYGGYGYGGSSSSSSTASTVGTVTKLTGTHDFKCPYSNSLRGRCTLPIAHNGAHKWTRTSAPRNIPCAHKLHSKRFGNWHGTYAASPENATWVPCATFDAAATATAAKSAGSSAEGEVEVWESRAAPVVDNDNLLTMLKRMTLLPLSEIEMDGATPTPNYEFWVYADELHGEHSVLTEQEIANLLVELIGEPRVAEYRDLYLETLDELGFELPAESMETIDVGEAEQIIEDVIPLEDVPLPDGTVDNGPTSSIVPGDKPVVGTETAAVAENKEEVSR